MARFFIHIHTGPADPNKTTLGCLIAATALQEGHESQLFLAGDGVHLLSPEIRDTLTGEGTGALADHLAAFAAGGGQIFVSRMSAKARGYDEALLAGLPAEFALPADLIRLSAAADTVLCY